MHRLAVSAKRKVLLNPKTVVIYVFAIFFTFLLAYHHRLSQHENRHEIRSLRIIQMRLRNDESEKNVSMVSEKSTTFLEKCENPPKEAKTDFNTFDLFESVVVGNSKPLPEKRINRKKEKLKVFVLPFTHVDPGWLETFENYTKRTNQILDNMHNFMMKNEKMRFMWAEFVFFERWWSLQTTEVKEDVKK
ncbi:unnamed protein product [Caenorhabditis sp. 36 PRJEB53466]|nr:unnamed protein product [Caenorhabditis sp. 36 PRJEB53466]